MRLLGAALSESIASITKTDDAGKVDGTLKVAQGANAFDMKRLFCCKTKETLTVLKNSTGGFP
jgi:hypothetical protein